MQNFLKNILSDPPNNLGSVSNFLLLIAAILLLSIFFMGGDDKDITLNILYDKIEAEQTPGESQVASQGFKKLISLVKQGQTIKKRDTIFSKYSVADLQLISSWRADLKKGKLRPTKEMLKASFVDSSLKNKLIALARAQVSPKKIDTGRIEELEDQIARFSNEKLEIESAIIKFKFLEKSSLKKYEESKELYSQNEIDLSAFKKARKNHDDMIELRKLRERQLKEPKFNLFNAQSELEAIYNGKVKSSTPKRVKVDNTFFEADIALSLDSIWKSSHILSKYTGEVKSIGKLSTITKGDVLISFAGSTIESHRSNTLIAEANRNDISKVVPGRELIIYLQDGSSINGEIVGLKEKTDNRFEIASSIELTAMDVDQIILPSKNGSFIEKVMENF